MDSRATCGSPITLTGLTSASPQALAKAGHDVRIATGSDFHERVREAGLIPLLAGPTVDDAFAVSEHDPRFAHLSLTQRGGATTARANCSYIPGAAIGDDQS